jgi:Leucine-rich repeat (LRR) protein
MGRLLQPIAIWAGSKLKSFDFTGDVDHRGALAVLSRNDFGNITFEVITIRVTNLKHIEADAFANNTQTTWKLLLPQNRLTEQVFSITSKFKKLQVLSLSGNQIKKIPADAFTNGQNELHKIDLRDNLITAVGNEAFAHLPSLEHISLIHNKISVIGSKAFMSTGPIVNDHRLLIELEENELTARSFRSDSLKGQRKVQINMAINSIEILHESIFRPIFESGGSIDLKRNPLSCGCSFPSYLLTIANEKCRNCVCRNGTSIHNLNPETVKCPVSAPIISPCVSSPVDIAIPPLPRSDLDNLQP